MATARVKCAPETVSLAIETGDYVAVRDFSGCGKSTLLVRHQEQAASQAEKTILREKGQLAVSA